MPDMPRLAVPRKSQAGLPLRLHNRKLAEMTGPPETLTTLRKWARNGLENGPKERA